jgi:hypothetical protein
MNQQPQRDLALSAGFLDASQRVTLGVGIIGTCAIPARRQRIRVPEVVAFTVRWSTGRRFMPGFVAARCASRQAPCPRAV